MAGSESNVHGRGGPAASADPAIDMQEGEEVDNESATAADAPTVSERASAEPATAEPATDERAFASAREFGSKPQDQHSLLRPETVESLFILWRLTHDEQ